MTNKYIVSLSWSSGISIHYSQARDVVRSLQVIAQTLDEQLNLARTSNTEFDTSVAGGPQAVYDEFLADMTGTLQTTQWNINDEALAISAFLAYMSGQGQKSEQGIAQTIRDFFNGSIGTDDSRWAEWQQWIIDHKEMWRLGGHIHNLFISEELEVVLAGLGPVGAVAGMALYAAGPILTYLENYEEEPYLIRGSQIAIIDAVIDTSNPLSRLNSGIQISGVISAERLDFMAEHYNIDPTLSEAMYDNAKRLRDTLRQGDLSNVQYDLVRLAVDVDFLAPMCAMNKWAENMTSIGVDAPQQWLDSTGLSYEHYNLSEDLSHLGDTLGSTLQAWSEMPDTAFDASISASAGQTTHYINNTDLPDGVKDSLNNAATSVVEYCNETSLFDTIGDLLPF